MAISLYPVSISCTLIGDTGSDTILSRFAGGMFASKGSSAPSCLSNTL